MGETIELRVANYVTITYLTISHGDLDNFLSIQQTRKLTPDPRKDVGSVFATREEEGGLETRPSESMLVFCVSLCFLK